MRGGGFCEEERQTGQGLRAIVDRGTNDSRYSCGFANPGGRRDVLDGLQQTIGIPLTLFIFYFFAAANERG